MRAIFYIIIFCLLLFPKQVYSQQSEYDIPVRKLYGTPSQSTSSRNFLKTDTTGGLQVPGGVQAVFDFKIGGKQIFTDRDSLNYKRGPDVLQGCSYFKSSFVTDYTEQGTGQSGNCICAMIRNNLDPSNPIPTNCSNNFGSVTIPMNVQTSGGGSQQTNLANGATCNANTECQSGLCSNNVCQP